MALKRQLYSETDLRSTKNFAPRHVITATFAADTTITLTDTDNEELVATGGFTYQTGGAAASDRGDIWPHLTPCYYDAGASAWKVWVEGQAIQGFILGSTLDSNQHGYENVGGRLQLDGSTTVQGLVMLTGDFDYNDVFLPPDMNPAGGALVADLRAACASGPRALGLIAYNLPEVR